MQSLNASIVLPIEIKYRFNWGDSSVPMALNKYHEQIRARSPLSAKIITVYKLSKFHLAISILQITIIILDLPKIQHFQVSILGDINGRRWHLNR